MCFREHRLLLIHLPDKQRRLGREQKHAAPLSEPAARKPRSEAVCLQAHDSSKTNLSRAPPVRIRRRPAFENSTTNPRFVVGKTVMLPGRVSVDAGLPL